MAVNMETPMRVDPSDGDSIGPYTVLKKLGEGSFGAVYKVREPDGSIVALKLLRLFDLYPSGERLNVSRRFELEFETGKIASPYLVETYKMGRISGNPYFTMLYCQKGSLQNLLGTKISSSFGKAISIDILRGLDALHTSGKIHRDLKPQNVLIDSTDRIRLTDFGIAGHLNLSQSQDNGKRVRLTTTDLLGKPRERFGSYPYMPPEQLRPANAMVTKLAANDIFSFGVTMYELMTGHYPFGKLTNDHADLSEYIQRVMEGRWTCISCYRPDLGPEWKQLIDGCLDQDFKKRYPSADVVLKLFGETVVEKPKTGLGSTLLTVMQGEEYGKEYGLEQLRINASRSLLRLGRKDIGVTNDIEIVDDQHCYISRYHATLEKMGADQWYIRDGQWVSQEGRQGWKRSVNGTYVNGTEIDERGLLLSSGDIITIGDTTIKYTN
jgi:serine/threonine protein kinase